METAPTFETKAPSWDVFDAGKLADHRFVAPDTDAGHSVLGYVVVSGTSKRPCYAGVVARHGFRVLGRQERIGRTVEGVWRDVLLLERRSAVVA